MEAIEEEATKAEEAAEGSASLDTFSQRQIFDPRAAFRRLVNELEEIFKAQDYNLMADASSPVGLFQWDVSLAGFRPDSPLAADMQMVGRKYGMSSVQLQISFKRGLHPFYPPSVRIISPRFHDPVLAAVASHPAFSADGWNPMMSAKEAILKIKSFLEVSQTGFEPRTGDIGVVR